MNISQTNNKTSNIYISSNKPPKIPTKPNTSSAQIISPNIIDTTKFLLVNNCLGELTTEEQKAKARTNLGLIFKENINNYILNIGSFNDHQAAFQYCLKREVIENLDAKIILYRIGEVSYLINQNHLSDQNYLLIYQYRQEKDLNYWREIKYELSSKRVTTTNWEMLGYEFLYNSFDGEEVIQLREGNKNKYPITLSEAVFYVDENKKVSIDGLFSEFETKLEKNNRILQQFCNFSSDKLDSENILANSLQISFLNDSLKKDYIKEVSISQEDWDKIIQSPGQLARFISKYKGFVVDVYEDSEIETPPLPDNQDNINIEKNRLTCSGIINNHNLMCSKAVINNNKIIF